MLLNYHAATLYGIVVDDALACYAYTNANNAMAANDNIMAYMNFVHKEIAISDTRCSIGMDASCYDDIFTDAIVVAYLYMGGRAFHIMKILWFRSDYSVLIDDVIVSYGCSRENRHMRHDNAIIANHDIFLNIGEWLDFYVFPQLCLRVYVC